MIVPSGDTANMTDEQVIEAYANIGIPPDTARRYLAVLRAAID